VQSLLELLMDIVRYIPAVAFIPLVIVESMRMEFPVAAPCAGKVLQVFCREGSQVSAGQDLIVLEAA
jgi:acetyl/propionyl-CoA carboxylase alpha subunit